MEELIRKFRTQFWQKHYDEMETTWLELVGADVSYEQLLELVNLTERQVPPETAVLMLQLLAESLREQKRFAEELAILRRQAVLVRDDAALSRTIAACVQQLYSGLADIEQLLHKSGLGYGQPLKEALSRLDRYLSFLPGTRVVDSDRGPGSVKKLDLLLDKVTVDFDRGAELVWDLGAAQRIVRVCKPDGYYTLLEQSRQRLLDMIGSEPGRVVALLLRDTGRAMTVGELRDALNQVVGREAWEGFWTRARRVLARDPHVVCRTSPARTFQWQETPEATPARTPAKAAKRPRYEVDVAELARMDNSGVLDAYSRLTAFPDRRRFLKTLPAARPDDWHEFYEAIFSLGEDGRARTVIEKELAAKHPSRWRVLLENTLTGYRQNAAAFLWLAEHFERVGMGDPKGVVMRVLDLLESVGYKRFWSKFRRALVNADYRLVRQALEKVDETEAGRLLGLVSRARILEGYIADEIGQLIVDKFPSLSRDRDDNAVYTTEQGLEKAKSELLQISEKEIPRVADEIARARAHGDLSENYEYKAAREKQGRLMVRAKRLREEIARARTVGASDVDTSEVSVGSRVQLANEAGSVVEYSILGPWDADTEQGIISYLSPFAQLLLGRGPGDSIEIDGQPFRITSIRSGLPS